MFYTHHHSIFPKKSEWGLWHTQITTTVLQTAHEADSGRCPVGFCAHFRFNDSFLTALFSLFILRMETLWRRENVLYWDKMKDRTKKSLLDADKRWGRMKNQFLRVVFEIRAIVSHTLSRLSHRWESAWNEEMITRIWNLVWGHWIEGLRDRTSFFSTCPQAWSVADGVYWSMRFLNWYLIFTLYLMSFICSKISSMFYNSIIAIY